MLGRSFTVIHVISSTGRQMMDNQTGATDSVDATGTAGHSPQPADPAQLPPAWRGWRNEPTQRKRNPMRWVRGPVEPAKDYGFFGPDSVTWRVWMYPTAHLLGFSRATTIEELDPFLVAAVDHTGKIYHDLRSRYDHTCAYFITVMVGDSETVVKSSSLLAKIHAKFGQGIEPISGLPYEANNPDSQLWILLTAWHSQLKVYEMLGPGPLSEADERRYWNECAIAAEFQTVDPDKVPRSREGVRAYFEEVRPRMAASEATQRAMNQLMSFERLYPPYPRFLKPMGWLLNKFGRATVLATIPHWQRDLADLHQSALVDRLVIAMGRRFYRLVARSRLVSLFLVAWMSPSSAPVAAPMMRGIPPESDEILSPAEAFRRYNMPTPQQVRAGLNAGTMSRTPVGD
ncbi:oxygenase MpaB family protein [Nocardia terpenica]|nr:oxygenase MpaB family protein [Nocardia terpenica]